MSQFKLISFADAKQLHADKETIYFRIRDIPKLMRPFQKAPRDHIITRVDDYAVLTDNMKTKQQKGPKETE
jgi:hypothetical protein